MRRHLLIPIATLALAGCGSHQEPSTPASRAELQRTIEQASPEQLSRAIQALRNAPGAQCAPDPKHEVLSCWLDLRPSTAAHRRLSYR